MEKAKEQKEKVFNITLTETEIVQEIAEAENQEDYILFLKVSNGQRIATKLNKLYVVLNKQGG